MQLTASATDSPFVWRIEPRGNMRVPGIIYADRPLIDALYDKVFEQVRNVATLPGIQQAAYAMPDAHWGYGFPIGGVAAFDPDEGGVISAGGVGFDISCGVRTLRSWRRTRRPSQTCSRRPFRRVSAALAHSNSVTVRWSAC